MTDDRILINGEWYVRESTIAASTVPLTGLIETVDWVTSEYCFADYRWEASRMVRPSSSDTDVPDFYPGVTVQFYDKGVEGTWDTVTESWENSEWFIQLVAGSPFAKAEAHESMSPVGTQHFIAFLQVLMSRGWIF
jgi:hypothetical protein